MAEPSSSSPEKIDITVVLNKGEKVVPLQLVPDTKIQTLKRLVAAEFRLPVSDQKVVYKGQVLSDSKTLIQSGVQSKDILEVQGAAVSQSLTSLNQIPPHIWQNPGQLQETIRGNPKLLNQLLHQNPTLATAVMSQGTFMLEQYFVEQRRARDNAKRKEEMEIARLQANPLDPEAQRRIQEIIREKNIRENMEQAIEHNPEAFGSVIMLYIPCAVNKKPLKAFVDSGAQMTIMSQSCAERVGLAHLIDTRWKGMAKGVGTSKITGRIHAAPIQIGSAFFTMSITILENQDMQFLFGLDQLRRHQACIDLKENCLRIQGQVVPFLSEKDIPKSELMHPGLAGAKKNAESKGLQGSSSSKKQKTGSAMETEASSVSISSSSRTNAGASASANQGHIATLMNMGFSQAQAQEALQVCGGNVELAASYLFNSQ